ncbi:lysoplasmalogenase [Algivirga pacifica]|uniref:Lysoplasmalogenase n=1 Tax=Algivirga pacifica TaxID=1162670 RepID=A0ABP9DB68_9BACT
MAITTTSKRYQVSKAWHVIFFLIVIGEVLRRILVLPEEVEYIVKPMIMLWISLYFTRFWRRGVSLIYLGMMFAFFFSWLGDVLLMFQQVNPFFFVTGLGAFLVAQCWYVFTFLRLNEGQKEVGLLKQKPWWIIPFLIVGGGLYWLLYPGMGEVLKVAVLFYEASILGMALTAFNLKTGPNKAAAQRIFIGALLFMSSDSVIALNRFFTEIAYAGYFIILTYIAAQYLIMTGVLKLIKEKNC